MTSTTACERVKYNHKKNFRIIYILKFYSADSEIVALFALNTTYSNYRSGACVCVCAPFHCFCHFARMHYMRPQKLICIQKAEYKIIAHFIWFAFQYEINILHVSLAFVLYSLFISHTTFPIHIVILQLLYYANWRVFFFIMRGYIIP